MNTFKIKVVNTELTPAFHVFDLSVMVMVVTKIMETLLLEP